MAESSAAVQRRRRRRGFLIAVLAVVALSLTQAYVVKAYQVPSESMQPTLRHDGAFSDRFLVNRLAYLSEDPRVGDVIVFARPDTWGDEQEHGVLRRIAGALGDVLGVGPSNVDPIVKRVIGTTGQTVRCCDEEGRLLVDERPLEERYVENDLPFVRSELDCAAGAPRCFPAVTVPAGMLLVAGDDRTRSDDSLTRCREAGASGEDCARLVPLDDVVGEAFAVIFPFDRLGQELQARPLG